MRLFGRRRDRDTADDFRTALVLMRLEEVADRFEDAAEKFEEALERMDGEG